MSKWSYTSASIAAVPAKLLSDKASLARTVDAPGAKEHTTHDAEQRPTSTKATTRVSPFSRFVAWRFS